jgi:predicted ABC-type ATPase
MPNPFSDMFPDLADGAASTRGPAPAGAVTTKGPGSPGNVPPAISASPFSDMFPDLAPAPVSKAVPPSEESDSSGFFGKVGKSFSRGRERMDASADLGRAILGTDQEQQAKGVVSEPVRAVAEMFGAGSDSPEKKKAIGDAVNRLNALDQETAVRPIKGGNFLSTGIYDTANVLGGMFEGLAKGWDEALVGAGVGAGAGALFGGVGALPGAIAGFKTGLTAGSAKEWYLQGLGDSYRDLVAEGINDTTARQVSSVAAAPYAAIEFVFTKLPGIRGLVKAADLPVELLKKSAAKIAGRLVLNHVVNASGEIGEEAAQRLTMDIARNVAADIHNRKTGDDIESLQAKDLLANMTEEALAVALPSIILASGNAMLTAPKVFLDANKVEQARAQGFESTKARLQFLTEQRVSVQNIRNRINVLKGDLEEIADPQARYRVEKQIADLEFEMAGAVRVGRRDSGAVAEPVHKPSDAMVQGPGSPADQRNASMIEQAATGVSPASPQVQPGLPVQAQPGAVPSAPADIQARQLVMVGDQGPFEVMAVPSAAGQVSLWNSDTGQSFSVDRSKVVPIGDGGVGLTTVPPAASATSQVPLDDAGMPAPNGMIKDKDGIWRAIANPDNFGTRSAASAPAVPTFDSAAVPPMIVTGPDGTRHEVAFPDEASAALFAASERFERKRLRPNSVDPVLDRTAKAMGVTKADVLKIASEYRAAVKQAVTSAPAGAPVSVPAPAVRRASPSVTPPVTGRADAGSQVSPAVSPGPGPAPAVQPNASAVSAPAGGPGPAAPVVRTGRRFEAVTPQGDVRVSGEWAVMDAAALITSDDARYDATLQPRNRDTKASQEQIAKIAAAPDPTRLNESPTTDLGAPLVDALGQVISGNGRVMGLRKAMSGNKGKAYLEFVRQRATELGVDVAGLKAPVLVRMVSDTGGTSMEQVAELSNRPQILQRTSAEVAAADAKVLSDTNIMDLFAPSEAGDIMAASNRDFLKEFVRKSGDESLRKSDGSFDREKMEPRIYRAVMMRLIGQTEKGRELARQAIENAEVLGIRPALVGVMRAGGKLVGVAKSKPQYDLSAELAEGLELLVQFKREFTEGKTKTLDGWLAQQDMFKAPASIEGLTILQELAGRNSIKGVSEFLNEYAERAMKVETATPTMFADIQPSTKLELLRGARDATAAAGGKSAGKAMREDRPEYSTDGDRIRELSEAVRPADKNKSGRRLTFDEAKFVLNKRPEPLPPDDPLLRPTYNPDNPAESRKTAIITDPENLLVLQGYLDLNVEYSREALWDAIELAYTDNKKSTSDNPVALFSGGGGGSGKSTILKRMYGIDSDSTGMVVIDPDGIKDYLPEYKALKDAGDGRAAHVVHEESSMLAKRVLRKAINIKADILYDSTMANHKKMMSLIRELKDKGYHLQLAAITIDPAESIIRAAERALGNFRFVPLRELIKAHKQFNGNLFAHYIELFDAVTIFENSGNNNPIRIFEKKGPRIVDLSDGLAYISIVERGEINEQSEQESDIRRPWQESDNEVQTPVGEPDARGDGKEADRNVSANAERQGNARPSILRKDRATRTDDHGLGRVSSEDVQKSLGQILRRIDRKYRNYAFAYADYLARKEQGGSNVKPPPARWSGGPVPKAMAATIRDQIKGVADKARIRREALPAAVPMEQGQLLREQAATYGTQGQALSGYQLARESLAATRSQMAAPQDPAVNPDKRRSRIKELVDAIKAVHQAAETMLVEHVGNRDSATFQLVDGDKQQTTAFLHRASRKPGSWQISYFDTAVGGTWSPYSHSEHETKLEAIQALAGTHPKGSWYNASNAGRWVPAAENVVFEDRASYVIRQTQKPEFNEWFRKSQVVDHQGNPLRVFHGTLSDFETFKKPGYFGKGPKPRTAGRQELGNREMHFFTSDPDVASNYANTRKNEQTGMDEFMVVGWDINPNVMPVYLSLQNPLRMTAEGGSWTRTVDRIKSAYDSGNYDGVIVYDVVDWYNANERMANDPAGFRRTSTVYIAFKPNQIKSATGNRGTFSRRDNSTVREEGRPAYGTPGAAPMWYSQLRRVLEQKMPKRAPVGQVRGLVDPARNSGIKAEEIEWSGLQDWLATKRDTEMVTRDEVLAAAQPVDVQEVTLGDNQISVEEAFRGYSDGELLDYVTYTLGRPEEDGPVSRSAMIRYISENQPVDGERAEASKQTRFDNWQLPGGENYRELLLTLPAEKITTYEQYAKEYLLFNPGATDQRIRASYNRFVRGDSVAVPPEKVAFKSPHFNQPNILAHVRFNERTDADGRRVLFIEEIQSDWHQKGREKGYGTENLSKPVFKVVGPNGQNYMQFDSRSEAEANIASYPESVSSRLRIEEGQRARTPQAVPNAPFKNNAWAKLAMKRMIRWAAENDFDFVAWTTGEQQAERYDLSKQVESVWVRKTDNGMWNVQIMPKGRNKDWVPTGTHESSKLPEVVGKELADKIVNESGQTGRYSGQMFHGVDLKVGGDGMKGFYDKILVNIANEIGRKWGAKVINSRIDADKVEGGYDRMFADSPSEFSTVHSLPITDALRNTVMQQGQALFERKPAGGYKDQISLFTPEVVAAARRAVSGDSWAPVKADQLKVGLEVRNSQSKEHLGHITDVSMKGPNLRVNVSKYGAALWTMLETTGRIINQEGTNEQVSATGTGRTATTGSRPTIPGVPRARNTEGRSPDANGDEQGRGPGEPVRRNPKLEQVGFSFESTTGKGVSGPGVSVETRKLAGLSTPGSAGLDLFQWSRTHAMVPEAPRGNADPARGKPSLVPTRNYNLSGKPALRVGKEERRRLNAQVKNILDKLDSENRPATEAEKDILRQYTGEGGLSSGTREALNQHFTDYDTTRAMWSTLESAGVPMVRALEGAAGSGNFVGQRPGLQWTTVDIDETNHRVLKALYPDAKHYLTSFEFFKDDGFDVAISNVPFLEMRNASGVMRIRRDIKSLHDFYFAHTLDRVKPNGVIAYITSTGTMDKRDAAVRREVIGKADVMAAYRLPEGHFSKNAHTEVTTDIIYLMRRPDGVAPSAEQQAINDAWAESAETADGIAMSRYYGMFPENILGEKTLGKDRLHGGKPMYVIKGPADLSRMSIDYRPYALPETKKKPNKALTGPALISSPPARLDELQAWAEKNGFTVKSRIEVTLSDGKKFTQVGETYHKNIIIEGDTVWRATDLVDLKDVEGTAKVYRQLVTSSADKIAMLDRITQLAEAYQNGDPAAATSAIELISEYRETFTEHPKADKALKSILEKAEPSMWAEFVTLFDETFAPADVFTRQTRYSDSGKAKVKASDPLRVRAFASENNKGVVVLGADSHVKATEWAALANEGYALVDVDDASVIKPFTMQNAILYFSGNIYEKIEQAEALRRRVSDPVQKDLLAAQLEKLENLKPLPKSLPEMTFRGTERWVLPILEKARVFKVGQETDAKSGQRKWTHPDKYVENYLNNHQLVNRSVDKEGNPTETEGQFMARTREAEEAVRQFYVELKDAIAARADVLQQVEYAYNSRYRNYVRPDYSAASYLVDDIVSEMARNSAKKKKPRRNQVEWAIQSLYEGKGINAHDVGGGKTDAAILLSTAMKRRGMAQKPMLVVPAKIIHKWERSIKDYFPDAKVVNLGKLDAKTRTEKLFQLANTNADFVLISHEGFENIELPAADELRYLDELLRENIDDPDYKGRKKGKLEESMAGLRKIVEQRPRDGRLTMDKLGVDMLIVDEGHNYKNIGIRNELVRFKLGTAFGINQSERVVKGPDGKPVVLKKDEDGVPVYKTEETASLKSARSYDLRFKSRYITERNNGNNVFLLTATPTPNKPMEVFTMLKHLDTHIFDEYGIETDKDFSNQFFDMGMVMNPTSGNAESVLRGIVNAQELRGILNRFVDKRTTDQLGIKPIPEENVVRHWLEQSDGYALVADDLRTRQQNMPPPFERQPGDDTIIAVYTGGRAASVDPRLYGGSHAGVTVKARSHTSETDKIQAILDLVEKTHGENPAAKQLIFLDVAGHQQAERGNIAEDLHREMKNSLVNSGAFRPEQVAIINGKVVTDPKTGKESATGDRDLKKQGIVDAYTEGKILVVIGTTTSMGEGMGLQKGTTDIYHADFPYTPGAIRQRNGRGVRYGNPNPVVNTHLFFMKGTFDGLSFGIIANKKGWNEAIWDKDVADYISTAEEMMGNAVPPREMILIEMETDPAKKAQLIAGFESNRVHQARAQAGEIVAALHGRRMVAQQNVEKFRKELVEREAKLRDLKPNEKIKEPEKRAEAFKSSKENLERLIDVSRRRIQENNQLLGNLVGQIQIQDAEYAAATRRLEAFNSRFVDQAGNIRVKLDEVDSVVRSYESGLTLGQPDSAIPSVSREEAEKYLTARDVTDPEAPGRLLSDLQTVRETSTEPYQMDLFAGVPNDADMTTAEVDDLANSLNDDIESAFTTKGVRDAKVWERVFTSRPVEASTIIPEMVKQVRPGEFVAARGIKIKSPADFAAVLMPLRNPLQESMKVAYLDASNRIIELRVVSVGLLDATLINSSLVFSNVPPGTKRLMIAHNHPSGDPSPSAEDIRLTRQLNESAQIVGLPILDHVVTNGGKYYSLRETGLVALWDNDSRTGNGRGIPPPKTIDEQAVAEWELVPRTNLVSVRDPTDFWGIVAAMRQADPNSGHAILVSTKYTMLAVVRFPEFASLDEIRRIVLQSAANNGAAAVFYDLPQSRGSDGSQAIIRSRALIESGKAFGIDVLDISLRDLPSLRSSGLVQFREDRAEYGQRAASERRTSITPEQDARYLELAKDPEKNKAALQTMVDDAAKAAGYNVGPVYHGSFKNDIEVFRRGEGSAGIYFTDSVEAANSFEKGTKGRKTYRLYLRPGDAEVIDMENQSWNEAQFEARNAVIDSFSATPPADAVILANFGDDGSGRGKIISNVYVIRDPSRVKSSDPVTRDRRGKPIPLSQRFDDKNQSILREDRPGMDSDDVAFDAMHREAVERGDRVTAQRLVDERAALYAAMGGEVMGSAEWSERWNDKDAKRTSSLKEYKRQLISHLADRAKAEGWRWGYQADPKQSSNFPWVVYFDTPVGQISFHVGTSKEFLDESTAYAEANRRHQSALADYEKAKSAALAAVVGREKDGLKVNKNWTLGAVMSGEKPNAVRAAPDFLSPGEYKLAREVLRLKKVVADSLSALKSQFPNDHDRYSIKQDLRYSGEWDKSLSQADGLGRLLGTTITPEGVATLGSVSKGRAAADSLSAAQRTVPENGNNLLRDGSNVKPPPVKSRDFATYDILPDGTKRLIPLSERFDRNHPSILRETPPSYGSAKPSKTVQEMERELEALRAELKHLAQRIPAEAKKANEGIARLLASKQKLIEQLLSQRENVAERQRILAAYMREQKLPDAEQRRMITAIIRTAKLKTAAGLERHYLAALEHIDRKATYYQAREHINKVHDLLRASYPKIINMYPRGKLTADAHRELKKIAVITNYDEKRVDKELDRLGDEIEAFSNPDADTAPTRPLADVLHEQFLIVTFGNLGKQTPAQAKAAVDALEQFIELGMFEHQAKEKARQARLVKLREAAVYILSGGKGSMDPVDAKLARMQKGVADKILKAVDAYDTGHQSFEWLLDKLSKLDAKTGVLKSELQYWADLAHRATHDEVTGRRQAWGQVQTKLQELYGVKGYRLAHILSENSKVVEKTGVIRNGKEVPLSRNEAYKLWQVFQDPTQTDRLLRNGYSVENVAQLEAFMGAKVKAYAQWQLDEFYPKYYEGVNRVYRELYFIDLPFNNRYSPIMAEFENAFEDDKMLENQKRQSSVLNGSLKMRKPNANSDIKLIDGDSLLIRHIVQMEHFKHWGLVMRDMRGVFNNSEVSRAVRDYHGDFAARALKGFVNDFARGGEDQALVLGSLDKLRSYFTRAVVASGVTTLKQLTSIPAAMADLGPVEFMSGLASFMTNPVGKSREMFEASKMLQNRYEAGFDRDVMLALRRSEPTRLSGAASIGEIFSWFTRGGDMAAVLAAGYTMYRSTMNKALASGKSAEQAKAEAIDAMERSVERVQQAGNVKDLGAFQRLGSFAKLFTMFMTAPIAYYRVWSGGWRNLIYKRGDPASNIRRIALTHIVLPVFFQWVADAFMWGNPDDDDEDDRLIPWLPKTQTRALALGPMNGLFILGNGLNHIVAAFQKERTYGDFASVILPPADIGNDVTKAARRIGRSIISGEITEKDLRSLLEDLAEAGGKLTGMPTGPAMRMGTGIYEGATGQTEFPIRRALGFSRFMLGEDSLSEPRSSPAGTRTGLRRAERPTLSGFAERSVLGE